MYMINFDQQVEEDVSIFNGTRKDVFDAMDFLVDQLHFVVLDRELVLRDASEIQSRHDIQRGDILPFISPFSGDMMCLGFDISNEKDVNRIVYTVGQLGEFEQNTAVGVDYYDLSNDGVRDAYTEMMDDLKAEHQEVMDNLKDILLIEATQEEFHAFIASERQRPENTNTTVYRISDETVKEYDVKKPSDVSSGMVLVGESQREDGSSRIGFLGYDIEDDDALINFLYEGLGGVTVPSVLSETPTVTRVAYDSGHIITELEG